MSVDKSKNKRPKENQEIKAVRCAEPMHCDNSTSTLGAAINTIAGLSARLKESASIVGNQKNRKSEATKITGFSNPCSGDADECAIKARLETAEKQLKETRTALGNLQDEQRDLAATAAQLRQKLEIVQQERDNALKELENATRIAKRACESAQTAAEERLAAQNQVDALKEKLEAVNSRCNQVEALEEQIRRREKVLIELRSKYEEDIAGLNEKSLRLDCQERKLFALQRRLEDREKQLEKNEEIYMQNSLQANSRERDLQDLERQCNLEKERLEEEAKALRMKSDEMVSAQQVMELEQVKVRDLQKSMEEERMRFEKHMEEQRKELQRLESAANAAQRMAENGSARARDAEASVHECRQRTIEEMQKLKEIQFKCSHEEEFLSRLRLDTENARIELQRLKANAQEVEVHTKTNKDAAEAAEQAAINAQQKLEEERMALNQERQSLEKARKALEQQECQSLRAAEDSRREQVVLACARRDSLRFAMEMKQKHLRAAAELETGSMPLLSNDNGVEDTTHLLAKGSEGQSDSSSNQLPRSHPGKGEKTKDSSGNGLNANSGDPLTKPPALESSLQNDDRLRRQTAPSSTSHHQVERAQDAWPTMFSLSRSSKTSNREERFKTN